MPASFIWCHPFNCLAKCWHVCFSTTSFSIGDNFYWDYPKLHTLIPFGSGGHRMKRHSKLETIGNMKTLLSLGLSELQCRSNKSIPYSSLTANFHRDFGLNLNWTFGGSHFLTAFCLWASLCFWFCHVLEQKVLLPHKKNISMRLQVQFCRSQRFRRGLDKHPEFCNALLEPNLWGSSIIIVLGTYTVLYMYNTFYYYLINPHNSPVLNRGKLRQWSHLSHYTGVWLLHPLHHLCIPLILGPQKDRLCLRAALNCT